MNNQSDQELLRRYVENGSEAAFQTLVRRHTDLVFSSALRMVRDSHLAEDVTQSVFLSLARSAAQLTNHVVLAGWLHQTARNLASKVVRTEVRRRAREQEVAALQLMGASPENPESSNSWDVVASHLDDVLVELSDGERDVVLLRYFQKKSAREIAETLKIGEEAAQRRVSRAVDRLRVLFVRREVALGEVALVGLLMANGVQAAPPLVASGIVGAVSSAGLFKVGGVVGAVTEPFLILAKTKTVIQALSVMVAVGGGLFLAQKAGENKAWLQRVEEQHAETVKQLQHREDRQAFELAVLREENERLRALAEVGVRDLGVGTATLPNPGEMNRADGTERAAVASLVTLPVEAAPEANAAAELGRQIGRAVVRGEAGAFEKLLQLSQEEHRAFRHAESAAINDEEREKVHSAAFNGTKAAFEVIDEAASGGDAIARRAIEEAIAQPPLQGRASRSLGELARRGNAGALEMLLNPERHGLLQSTCISALKGAADNGDERAIQFICGYLHDPKNAPLLGLVAQGLEQSAIAGHPLALDAMINLLSRTNAGIRAIATSTLQKAAAQQHPKALEAVQTFGLQRAELGSR